MLGDDAVRDKRLAVGVVAAEEDGVLTLKVAPQKFLSSLDPLTLRLFGKLRQQQQETLQVIAIIHTHIYHTPPLCEWHLQFAEKGRHPHTNTPQLMCVHGALSLDDSLS